MDREIIFFDTTLRDGEQSAGVAFSLEDKLQIALQLQSLGINIIEAGFPASSEEDFLCVKEVAKKIKNCVVCGLARAIEQDIKVCWDALKDAKFPRIHTFINASDIQIQYQLKKTKQQVIEQARTAVMLAKSFCKDVEFSPMDATRADPDFLLALIEAAIECGATVINVPDTVGYSVPEEICQLFRFLIKNIKKTEHNVIFSFHGHDDLGMSTANSIAAIQGGATQVEGTINGIGERAGNTALEEVIMAVHKRGDQLLQQQFYASGNSQQSDLLGNTVLKSTINFSEIYRTSKLVERLSGLSVPQNKAIVGKNAFRHGSGIHQDGILKNRDSFEILDPKVIGIPEGTQLVLGKLSGRNGLKSHLEKLGYNLTSEELTSVFKSFKDLTAKKKEIDDRDLESLVNSNANITTAWLLESLQVMSGKDIIPSATVTLKNSSGQTVVASCVGTGPIDAIYEAINELTDTYPELELFDVKAVTHGIDSQGEVQVKLRLEDRFSIGMSSNTDISVAAAQAYLNAICRLSKVM